MTVAEPGVDPPGPSPDAPAATGAGGGGGHGAMVAGVARGGTANLLGALVYGMSGFVLLIVLNRGIGVHAAGVVVVAIAIFNIVTIIAGLGTSTSLVRQVGKLRATGRAEELPAALWVGLVPVTIVAVATSGILWASAPALAEIFASGRRADEVTDVLRAMVIFAPFAALHTVIIQATRGFDTMMPQVMIEKIGRSLSLPIVAGGAAALGMGPKGVGAAWAASNVPALALSSWALWTRVHKAVAASGKPRAKATRAMSREFWAYSAPLAVNQASNVVINWFDTVLVGAILSTTAAGIYASGTRYLLPGLFAADALVQVVSPRLAGLLATGKRDQASALVQIVGGWQVAAMWPIYLITLLFPTPLLEVFGNEILQARGALMALSVAMLLAAPVGPSGAVILMAGRSRQAMFNTFAVLAVNIGGNLVFVPRYGLTAAGVVWGASILTAAGLTGWQTNRTMHVRTTGRPALTGVAVAASTIGAVGLAARLLVGDDGVGLLATTTIGGALYLAGLWKFRATMHLDSWWSGVRRRSTPERPPAGTPARGTP